MSGNLIRSAAVAALAAGAAMSSAQASILNDFNLIVLGELNSNSEVEGRAFVGGNLSGSASNYGIMLTPASSYLNVDVLMVGGNMTGDGVNMNAGNLRRSGTRSGYANMNGGGQDFVDASVAAMVPSFVAELNNTSAYLASLPANSTISLPGSQPAPATFNAVPNSDGVAIFSVNAAQLFSNNNVQQLNLNANGATSIIVNVTGSSVLFNQGNFTGAWNTEAVRATTLWNFFEAETITFDRPFNGAVLAPDAALSSQHVIEGSVFVESFTQRGEVHLPGYRGFIPTPGAGMVLALGGLIAARRRR